MKIGEEISINSRFGEFRAAHYLDSELNTAALLIYNKPWGPKPILRIHSACLFSESIGTLDCDCSSQLSAFLTLLKTTNGLLIYLFQEGRGAGLRTKMQAISLQQNENLDTASAFERLGLEKDMRSYEIVLEILKDLDFPKTLSLATNNPARIDLLHKGGYSVERLILQFERNPDMNEYLTEKRRVLGHLDEAQ
jgi:GTP cyclohydrolase II